MNFVWSISFFSPKLAGIRRRWSRDGTDWKGSASELSLVNRFASFEQGRSQLGIWRHDLDYRWISDILVINKNTDHVLTLYIQLWNWQQTIEYRFLDAHVNSQPEKSVEICLSRRHVIETIYAFHKLCTCERTYEISLVREISRVYVK